MSVSSATENEVRNSIEGRLIRKTIYSLDELCKDVQGSSQWMGRSVAVCGFCDEAKATQLCSSCRIVFYCGRECQTSAWPAHKKECKEWKKERESCQASLRDEWEKNCRGKEVKELVNKELELFINQKETNEREELLYESLLDLFKKLSFKKASQKKRVFEMVEKCKWQVQTIGRIYSECIEYLIQIKRLDTRIDLAAKQGKMKKEARLTSEKKKAWQAKQGLEQDLSKAYLEKEKCRTALHDMIKKVDDINDIRSEAREPSLES